MKNFPLGLPDGSIRSILALAFSGATIYLWVTGSVVPVELLATTSLVVGNYFGYRSAPGESAPRNEPVNAPYIPGESDGNG